MQQKTILLKEFFRKIIHLCSAIIPFLLDKFYWQVIIALFIVVSLFVLSEIIRLEGFKVPLISKITEFASRERDENKIVLGPISLVFGIITAAILLPYDAMRVGIYALAFGDGLASLVGKMFGKTKIPFTNGKTIAGSLACFCAVILSTFYVSRNLIISFIIALFAMLVEMLPLEDLDNIVIPISIGGIYYLIQMCVF